MHSNACEGIVLKRSNYGEADRIVTVLSKEMGKISVLAKGIRKITSTKRSALEPGDRAKMLVVQGKGTLPLLTQATLITDHYDAKKTLRNFRNLSQVLEILDTLIVEGEGQEDVYEQALRLIECVGKDEVHMASEVKKGIIRLLNMLGFDDTELQKRQSVTTFIEELSNRKLKSFSYLMP